MPIYNRGVADSYTALFSVQPASGQPTSDLFDNVVDEAVSWANSSGAGLEASEAGLYRIESGGECEISTDVGSEGRYWRLRWNRPDGDGRPLSWASDVRLAMASTASEVEVFVQVRVVSEPGASTPEPANVGTPRLVRNLTRSYGAHAGARPLRESPMAVGVGDESEFIENDVLASDRVLPILAISPRVDDNRPYLSGHQVRRAGFVGLAEVVFLQTASATRNISDLLGQDFGCYNGAVRVWWPGIDPENDDPRDHRLWLPARVAEGPVRVLNQTYNLLARVAERRAHDGGPVWRQVRGTMRHTRESEFRQALGTAELVDLADEQLKEMPVTPGRLGQVADGE